MAFIELTPEELSLLGKQEREQYEKELKLHQERAAFVEQLEKIENADFRYEKPKFKRIKPVRRMELPEYKKAAEMQVELPSDIIGAGRNIAEKSASLPSEEISAALSGTKAAVSGVPDVKVTIPRTEARPVTEIPAVSGIAPVTPDVPEPHVEPAEICGIAGLPTLGRIEAPEVGFEFSPEPVTIGAVKVQLPEIPETSGIGAVEIRNIPAAAAKIAPPTAEFSPVTANVSGVAPKRISGIRTSEIDDRIAALNYRGINTRTFTAEKPNIPDISVSAAPQFETSVPSVSCNVPAAAEFGGAIETAVKTPAVTVPKPAAVTFDSPKLEKAGGISTFTVPAPKLAYEKPAAAAKDVPAVKFSVPPCTGDEISRSLDAVMRKLQGAKV